MSYEYSAKITVTKMAENGDVSYKKSFNGTCTVGVNKRTSGSIAKKAEAYLNAVKESIGTPGLFFNFYKGMLFDYYT